MSCEAAKLSSFIICIYSRHLHIACLCVSLVCILQDFFFLFLFYNGALQNHICYGVLILDIMDMSFLIRGMLRRVFFFFDTYSGFTSVLERQIQKYVN